MSVVNEPVGSPGNPYPITPRLDTISPTSVAAGSAPFLLTCTGRAFVKDCQISVGGVLYPATYVGASTLTATVTPKATPGTSPVVVISSVSASKISTSPQTMTWS